MIDGPFSGWWRLQRAWHDGSARWWAWCGGACVAIPVACIALASVEKDRIQLHSLPGPQSPPPAARQQEPAIRAHDFARALGAGPSTAAVLQELQRACARANVALISEQLRSRAPSGELLGRLELTMSLRGSYAGTKHVLKQVVDRFPSITVQRLVIRHGAAPGEVDVTATLSIWSAPLIDVGAAAASRKL